VKELRSVWTAAVASALADYGFRARPGGYFARVMGEAEHHYHNTVCVRGSGVADIAPGAVGVYYPSVERWRGATRVRPGHMETLGCSIDVLRNDFSLDRVDVVCAADVLAQVPVRVAGLVQYGLPWLEKYSTLESVYRALAEYRRDDFVCPPDSRIAKMTFIIAERDGVGAGLEFARQALAEAAGKRWEEGVRDVVRRLEAAQSRARSHE
jgi:hypothetical protein